MTRTTSAPWMNSWTRTLRSTTTASPRYPRTCTQAFVSLTLKKQTKKPLHYFPYQLTLHPKDLCRGNFIGGRHFSDGAYDIIAQKLFNELNVDTFYLEYDTARAGGFEPLRHLPKHKNVVVGVISTKLRALEDKEEMKARVRQAAAFVAEGTGQTPEEALRQVAVSPQCGFSTHESGYPLSEEDERKKLALVRQVADEIWGEP